MTDFNFGHPNKVILEFYFHELFEVPLYDQWADFQIYPYEIFLKF